MKLIAYQGIAMNTEKISIIHRVDSHNIIDISIDGTNRSFPVQNTDQIYSALLNFCSSKANHGLFDLETGTVMVSNSPG